MQINNQPKNIHVAPLPIVKLGELNEIKDQVGNLLEIAGVGNHGDVIPFSGLTDNQKALISYLIGKSGIENGNIHFGKENEALIRIIPGSSGELTDFYVTGSVPTGPVGEPILYN